MKKQVAVLSTLFLAMGAKLKKLQLLQQLVTAQKVYTQLPLVFAWV